MTIRTFVLAALAYLPLVFLGMAILIKWTHARLARATGSDPASVWTAALVPGVACTAVGIACGLWPVALDCALSAVAFGLLGRRLLPPPRFEV